MASTEIFSVDTIVEDDIKNGIINGEITIFISIFKDNMQKLAQIKRDDLLQYATGAIASKIYNGFDYKGLEKEAMLDARMGGTILEKITEIKSHAETKAAESKETAISEAKKYTDEQIKSAITDVINSKY